MDLPPLVYHQYDRESTYLERPSLLPRAVRGHEDKFKKRYCRTVVESEGMREKENDTSWWWTSSESCSRWTYHPSRLGCFGIKLYLRTTVSSPCWEHFPTRPRIFDYAWRVSSIIISLITTVTAVYMYLFQSQQQQKVQQNNSFIIFQCLLQYRMKSFDVCSTQ